MKRIIFHIDVNNAFLSWTAISLLKDGYKYDIRDSYAVIGGDPKKRTGVVLAKSNSCKKLGIVTGEPIASARKKCPVVKSYPPNFKIYQQMSNKLFELLRNYTPDIEILSIDECFLDYTGIKNKYGDPISFANNLKEKIKESLGFTVNIGIANNKLCAKMASDFEKPNRVHTLFEDEVKEKLWPLEVGKLYGVGKRSTELLNKLNIYIIEDLANTDCKFLYKYFKNMASKMIEKANGIDSSIIDSSYQESKCISSSRTLEYDYVDKIEIYKEISDLADHLGMILRKKKLFAGVIAIVVKNQFFKSYSKQITLKNATNITSEIKSISEKLFDEAWDKKGIRLIGIRLDKLTDEENYQMSLFEGTNDREQITSLDKAIDEINEKYGISIIKRGIN